MTQSNHGQYAINFYLDYWVNYLTVAKIAEHYNISEKSALGLIDRGRELFNKQSESI